MEQQLKKYRKSLMEMKPRSDDEQPDEGEMLEMVESLKEENRKLREIARSRGIQYAPSSIDSSFSRHNKTDNRRIRKSRNPLHSPSPQQAPLLAKLGEYFKLINMETQRQKKQIEQLQCEMAKMKPQQSTKPPLYQAIETVVTEMERMENGHTNPCQNNPIPLRGCFKEISDIFKDEQSRNMCDIQRRNQIFMGQQASNQYNGCPNPYDNLRSQIMSSPAQNCDNFCHECVPYGAFNS